VSSSEQLEHEAIAFSYDSSPGSIPSVDEIVSSLSGLRGDLSHLSDLKSVEDQVVDDLFQVLMKLTRLLQWAPVETSVLPVELGMVESAHVTPEGSLIYFHDGGEIGSLDLSQYDNRDVLVDVVRDLVPKLREILENPPKFEEPVIEEPEPEPVAEEPVVEEPTIEEPVMEEIAEVEEPAVEEEPITEQPQVMEEPEAEEVQEEVQEEVIEETVEPPTPRPTPPEISLTERPLTDEVEFKPKPEKKEPRDRNVDLLWAVLKGQRIDSFREIRDYRAKRKEENGKLLKALRKRKGHEIEDHRSFIERLKDAFTRRRKEKE
jgi:hypothetical protein